MRPLRLELEGFASFRQRTVVEFADTELFVLTGPTGAGKSSLIDAMVFALYGSVPRYGHKGLVEPVINRGLDEARVLFEFCAGGRRLVAARVVRRTGDGRASTKEARLEEVDGRVLASGAPEVTAAVETLLGLSFEHFTRCVVLPQGEFARFLHGTATERQDLLVALLDLEIYRRVGKLANERARSAHAQVKLVEELLTGELGMATPERLAAARDREAGLAEGLRAMRQKDEALQSLVADTRELRAAAVEQTKRAEALERLRPPEDLTAVAGEVSAARTALADLQAELTRLQSELDALQGKRDALGDAARLQQLKELWRQRQAATLALAEAEARAGQAATQSAEATKALELSKARLAAAREAREALANRHRAHALAEGLAEGDDCPVCGRELELAPTVPAPTGIEEMKAELGAAEADERRGESEHRAALAQAARAEQEVAGIQATLTEVELDLAGAPAAGEVEQALAAIGELDAKLRAQTSAVGIARAKGSELESVVKSLEAKSGAAWTALHAARDRLSAMELEPPGMPRDDLAVAWRLLLEWCEDTAPSYREKAALRESEAEELDAAVASLEAEVARLADQLGLEVTPETRAVELCATALGTATAEAAQLERMVKEAKEQRAKLEGARESAQVAHHLGLLLQRNRFESWLLRRAMLGLAATASSILQDLSPQQPFSLRLDDDGSFQVVDHLNADEVRTARSLSGGETFLASLSLALALAEQLAQLAGGATRLEALFLDEGFGSLDSETLDVVADAIIELGARGRMVGLVTHVAELADRMPVRYSVRKSPTGSIVTREAA